jgi:hypothetical protein
MTFDELVQIARRDEAIVGLVHTGSRGRGFAVTDESDWDVRLIVRDDARDEYRSRLATPHGSSVNVVVLSVSEFADIGAVGSASAWDRYSYVRATVVVDEPGGSIARLVAEKSVLPRDAARAIAAERLDDYVNSYYRAAKNRRADLGVESRLDAAESLPPLLDFLFAVHERVRPFNRFLRWELDEHPLPGDVWAAESLLPRLQAILITGALETQQSMFRDIEELARSHGLGDVIDAWEPDLSWLRGDRARE